MTSRQAIRLRCENVSFGYQSSSSVVDRVSFQVREGETFALLGPSGSGKTTLLRLIAGLETSHQGTIHIHEQMVEQAGQSLVPPERRQVGMVFQHYALFPHLSVEENIRFGLDEQDQSSHSVARLLELTNLSDKKHRYPAELSGGEQQRVALARALAPEPELLLLDEPFANLDAVLRRTLREQVRELLSELGTTTVFVTHDQEEALSLADSVGVIFQGNIQQVASPYCLYYTPSSIKIANFVGETTYLPGQMLTRNKVETALGTFESRNGSDQKNVRVLLRPDQIVGTETKEKDSVVATIHSLRFFGHDSEVRLQVEGVKGLITARFLGDLSHLKVGQSLFVQVLGRVVVYESKVESKS